MRRGLLKDYANALCGVVTGWQLEGHLDLLEDRRVGTFELDVLRGTAQIDGSPVSMRDAVATSRSWLLDRADRDGLAVDAIDSATVVVAFEGEEKTEEGGPRWRLRDYRCQSRVSAAGRVATGSLHKTEVGIYDPWTASWTFYEGQAADAGLKDFPALRRRYAAARSPDV